MPRNGAYTLLEADPRIVIVCEQCRRRGEYSRQRLYEKYGDISLPTILGKIVGPRCSRYRDITHLGGCTAKFENPASERETRRS